MIPFSRHSVMAAVNGWYTDQPVSVGSDGTARRRIWQREHAVDKVSSRWQSINYSAMSASYEYDLFDECNGVA